MSTATTADASGTAMAGNPGTPICKLCRGKTFRHLLSIENANFSSRIDRYTIQRCTSCGLSMMDPFPNQEDINEIYVRDSTFSQPFENPYRKNPLFPILEPIYRRFGDGRHFIVRNCIRLAPKGRRLKALDIGCGTGALIEAFRTMTDRTDAIGIDIDPMARERAREDLKDSIVIGDFHTHPLPGPFDIITMEMMIEHLLDVSSSIERCASILRPGGVLSLSTPDIDSPAARQRGADWWLINRHNQKIGHVIWFNQESVEALARTFGFRIAYYRNRGNLLPHMPGWLRKPLEAVLSKDPASGRFIRWYPIRILWALLITSWLSESLSKGEYLYAFLVKEE